MRKEIEKIIKENFQLSDQDAKWIAKDLDMEYDLKESNGKIDEKLVIDLALSLDKPPIRKKKVANLNKKIITSKVIKKLFEVE